MEKVSFTGLLVGLVEVGSAIRHTAYILQKHIITESRGLQESYTQAENL
ncbi:MAG: hypothetical protein KatS3mg031_1596 [Chitinophagales bacterium]|nr:MAG: hypothetical protein KatS3mg031_1596 [Chitinophagales bacterium]